jgi:hypothetical protein
MPTVLQLRRGTTAEHSTFTGAVGEVTVDTTKDSVVVHDGATAGGVPLATEAYVTTQIQTKDNTDEMTEGSTNLYYTDARADARITAASTSDLSEGTNLYYTDARADARITAASTSDLSEGTNLYYTDARADARADLKVTALIDSSPAALNTLNELAAALGDDASFSTTVTNSIATKLASSSVSVYGLTLVDDADAATARTTLGLGTAATTASTDYATSAQGTTADNALAASSYTAADVLTKVKTVDGAASGLDADLLDGQQGSYYASVAGTETLTNKTLTTPALNGAVVDNNNAVSAAGSTQADATALTVDYNVVTTVGASAGVKLPTGTAGRRIVIVNKGANTLTIYPATSAYVDAGLINVGISVAANGSIELMASSSTQWYSIARVAVFDSTGTLLN